MDRDALIDTVAELRTGAAYLKVSVEEAEIRWVAPAAGLIMAAAGLLVAFFAPSFVYIYATVFFAALFVVCVIRIVASRYALAAIRQDLGDMEARHAYRRAILIEVFADENTELQ